MPQKRTLLDFKILVYEKHEGKYDFSESKYTDSFTDVICKCNKCKNIFGKKARYFLEKNLLCPFCETSIGNCTSENLIIKYKFRFPDSNLILKNFEYKGNQIKGEVICPKHGIKYVRPNDLLSGYGCNECGYEAITGRHPLDIEIFKNRLDNNVNLIENTFINTRIKAKFNCSVCGNIWKSRPNTTRHCPKCSNFNQPGFINKVQLERNKEKFKNTESFLYFVELYNKNEKFLKIGITMKSSNQRFKSIPYSYFLIKEIKSNHYDNFYREQEILKTYFNNRYIPQLKFGGHTECLNYYVKELIFKELEK